MNDITLETNQTWEEQEHGRPVRRRIKRLEGKTVVYEIVGSATEYMQHAEHFIRTLRVRSARLVTSMERPQ